MSPTRRSALQVAAGVLTTGFAGCLSGEDGSSDRPRGELVTEYERVTDSIDDERTIWRVSGDDADGRQSVYLTSHDELATVTLVADVPRLEAFLEATDPSRSALCLFQRSVGECRTLDAYKVIERPDELRVYLCEATRPADVSCRTDAQRTMALALRVPADGEPPAEMTTIESSRCEDRWGPHRNASEDGGGDG